MTFLKAYCESSGQRINAEKSSFMVSDKAPLSAILYIKNITRFRLSVSLMDYLGVPIFQGRTRNGSIQNILAAWFSKGRPMSIEYLAYTLIPVTILWEIWVERCRRKHLDEHITKPDHKYAVIVKVRYWMIRMAKIYTHKYQSSHSFSFMAKLLGIPIKNPPTKPPMQVFWTRPPDNWVVLNTDGAANDNMAGGGGVIRDTYGKRLVNFFAFYGEGSNNLAETRGILDGLTFDILPG
ncbi:hypothetical protein FRX31_008864 [Thalictrum thalictroides]|uniref:RNase H type-1 domain-containing protein n=1 Tax=Thalictrum thalictroides TaxID=46969 RepID=A0A7J6WYA7_THATH|nr:hypothetical protein FRX31_008864 [Thalictrum thalictroides]